MLNNHVNVKDSTLKIYSNLFFSRNIPKWCSYRTMDICCCERFWYQRFDNAHCYN